VTANVSLRKGYDAGYLNAGHGTGGCAGAGPGGLAVDACGFAEEQQLEK
jgi:hypothetical protein